MRVGIDTFSLSCLKLSPIATLDWLKAHDFAGAQWCALAGLSSKLDEHELKDIQEDAARLGLYSHASLPSCNPHQIKAPLDQYRADMAKQIELAARCGWHELHTNIGGGDERYLDSASWVQQLKDVAQYLRSLAPVLRAQRSRIDIETHGDVTTFELIRIIEDVGPDIAGICLDTANLFCQCEDPVRAAKRAAPYVHLTHIKDAMMVPIRTGYRRQTLPPGRGIIAWDTVLPILAEYEPNLPLSIEDHKWLFDFHVFDPHWLRLHPDLTVEEYASVMHMMCECRERVIAGTLPDPATYEKIPYIDEVEDRLHAGRDHLNAVIARRGLQDVPGHRRNYQCLSLLPDKSA